MKQILLIATFFLTLWVISCEEKSADGAYTGTWIADEITVSNCQDEARNTTERVTCEEEGSCYKLVLNNDRTYTFQQEFLELRGNWSRNGRKLFLCIEDEGEKVCDEYRAVLTNISLVVTADSTSSGCITTYNFNRAAETEETAPIDQ